MGSSAPAPSPTVASLDVENLWIPAASVAHGNWITTLVGALITSGAMDDEVLVQLKPVCETKVCWEEGVVRGCCWVGGEREGAAVGGMMMMVTQLSLSGEVL